MNKNKLKFIAAILTIGAAWFVVFGGLMEPGAIGRPSRTFFEDLGIILRKIGNVFMLLAPVMYLYLDREDLIKGYKGLKQDLKTPWQSLFPKKKK